MAEPVGRDVERREEREALEKLVEALKEALVELRSAINDLNNPIIRGIGPAPEARPREEDREPPSQGESQPTEQPGAREEFEAAWSRILGENGLRSSEGSREEPRTPTTEKERPSTSPVEAQTSATPTPTWTSGAMGGIMGEHILEDARGGTLSLSRLARLMRIIYELSDKAPPGYFTGLIEILQDTGLIEERQANALKKLIEMVGLAKDHGLTVEENLMLMALISRELGVSSDDLMEELVKAMLSRLKGERGWESQQH